jgi:hypothetical protein
MLSRRPDGPAWTLELPGQLALDAMVLATLLVVIPKLPRPTRRAVAVLPAVRLRGPQWRLGAPLAPPRTSLLAI